MEVRKINQNAIRLSDGNIALTASPNGLKIDGKVESAGTILSKLTKGTARRFRKALRKNGFSGHAGARRAS